MPQRHPYLEVQPTSDRGRGAFTTKAISLGAEVLVIAGWYASTAELQDHWFVLQVGPDRWLCSDGEALDDCINHSCVPNVGFVHGEPTLFALRDIAAGEEIVWDYSTSIAERGWSLTCRCGTSSCRGVIRPWPELPAADRTRLRPIALAYLRSE